ncbi:MAG: queuosine precursor transporter [Bacteroidaceae bacterium]|nr:queuosine precursor transporter [Bacteroidaceae bacterium]
MNRQKESVSVTFMLLGVTFCVCLILANLLATKQFLLGPLNLTTGVLVFPISYVVNDCITEVWGYHRAKLVIWTGFAMNFAFVTLAYLADLIPGAPYWDNEAGFHALFGLAPRVALASFAAFLVGSLLNAYVMSRMKLCHKGEHFSLRAIASTVAGEVADSLIFFPIALGGIVPTDNLLLMMASQVVVKTLYEIMVLPVTIGAVRWLKRTEGLDVYDEGITYSLL